MNDKVLNEDLLLKAIGSEVSVKPEDFDFLFPDFTMSIKVELYCPICKEKRIFKCSDVTKEGYYLNKNEKEALIAHNNELLIYDFSCEYNHKFKVSFETLGKGTLVKFGQYPSPMYFSKTINNDITKELDEVEKKYYLLSIKSQENNLNIASLVYLRRVFESLIEKAKNKSEKDFTGMRTKDIIKQLVKENLLNEMLKNTGYNVLYTLLSDGVHNLSEEECHEQFELLKSAIEIILEDEIYKKQLEKRKINIGNLLSNKNSEKIKN